MFLDCERAGIKGNTTDTNRGHEACPGAAEGEDNKLCNELGAESEQLHGGGGAKYSRH